MVKDKLYHRKGARTVVHPKARIIAEAGPIIIGESNLIEEQALIINRYPQNIMPDTEKAAPKTMVIGTNNLFEVGSGTAVHFQKLYKAIGIVAFCVNSMFNSSSVSQALKIGDNNVIESKADLGRNVILTSGCIIGACCQINTCEVVPENTVVYGSKCIRRVQSDKPQPQTLQLDFLMKILPNYHHLKKTVKTASTPNCFLSLLIPNPSLPTSSWQTMKHVKHCSPHQEL
ncbi:dynactin subunit 6-like isoform X2 [Synchiropus splendidus]|uniref:dynactin subunit 6-like isoform X2 n=1 Tax=Synchiropus splendidus TaxID=270530 RepID=UPI00237E8FBC|nr:dynactin subunit 6-like isoform X2 [Synchiropus splendidus]